MQPRIRLQAYLVGALPLAFLLVLLGLGLAVDRSVQMGASLSQHTQIVLSNLDHVQATLEQGNRAATATNVNGAPRVLTQTRAQFANEFRTLHDLVATEAGMPARLDKLRSTINEGMALLDRYVALRRSGKSAAAQRLGNSAYTRNLDARLTAATREFQAAQRGWELDQIAQLRAQTKQVAAALVLVSIIGVILTIVFAGRFGFRIVQRLERLAENARRLAAGEPARALEGDDEFARLDRVYRDMMKRIAQGQHVVAMLQRTLLPQEVPSFPGIRIDTAYVPATQETSVGGDWYDVFKIADRRICISIGDVAGSGLHAAAAMASARLAVRTAARIESDPGRIMQHLNRGLCADEPGTLVTALIAILDVDDGTLFYSVAGHPEPLLIRADGDVDFLPGKGIALGIDADSAYETFASQLDEGWALVLYTDGLIELEHDYFKGVDELRGAAAQEFARSSENIAEAIQRRVFEGRTAGDDVAVLFIGVTSLGIRRSTQAQRTWVFDARDAESAHRAKRAILWHLGSELRDEEQMASVELVLGELIGNVARHSPGLCEVSVEQQAADTVLRVNDSGKPFTPQTTESVDLLAESGRGLFIVRNIARDVHVEHDGVGNTVTAYLPAPVPAPA